MIITETIKAEILAVMQDYWDSYLSGNLHTWASYLPDNYQNIGTTVDEVWRSKQEIVDYTKEVIDQIVGLAEFRNKKTTCVPYAPYIMVHEMGDLYVKSETEGWVYYASLRLSSLLEKVETGWQILHQHGSYPDSRADQGETFGFEQLKVENKRLKDAILSRTKELEIKNRELEIEAVLERIRALATAMQDSSDLFDIVVAMRQKFLSLGHEADYFWHMRWMDDQYEMSMTSEDGNRIGMVITVPKFVHDNIPSLAKWEKGGEPAFVLALGPDDAWDYIDNMNQHGQYQLADPHAPTEEDIHHIGGLTFIMARTTHGEIGFSLAGEVPDPPQESIDTLIRFAGVFDLAYRRFEDLQQAEMQATKIKTVNEENERLLHSILPRQIAEQIRSGQQTIVDRYEDVSILFADIVGFTSLSEKESPNKVVDILNGLFSLFDDLTDKYKLEKIKTIGDAYMVASGVPLHNGDHAEAIFLFAKEMLEVVKQYGKQTGYDLDMRVGISSGPVVAGVIGKKKFTYDLWGDSVNTAARMEAYGQTGKIQVSPSSYALLKDSYQFEKVPSINVKGKGEMDVYLWQP